jgi:hypothetical protein
MEEVMSEPTTEVPAAEVEPNAVETPPEPTDDKPLGENGEKALKSERARAAAAEKERDALKSQLDAIAKQQMSDVERAQAEAAEFKAQAEKSAAEALRFKVASQHSISAEDAELFLTGTDEETLTKQAARLVERTPTSPRPDPSQGSRGGNAARTTAEQFAAAIEDSFTR